MKPGYYFQTLHVMYVIEISETICKEHTVFILWNQSSDTDAVIYVCGFQGLAHCAPVGSALRCPGVLPQAWRFSLLDPEHLSQAWISSWWAVGTACHWWRRGLPQVRPVFYSFMTAVTNVKHPLDKCRTPLCHFPGKYMAGCSLWARWWCLVWHHRHNICTFFNSLSYNSYYPWVWPV